MWKDEKVCFCWISYLEVLWRTKWFGLFDVVVTVMVAKCPLAAANVGEPWDNRPLD